MKQDNRFPSRLWCTSCETYRSYILTCAAEDKPLSQQERKDRVMPLITIYPKCDSCGSREMCEFSPKSITVKVEIRA